jgi:hypothetical protein
MPAPWWPGTAYARASCGPYWGSREKPAVKFLLSQAFKAQQVDALEDTMKALPRDAVDAPITLQRRRMPRPPRPAVAHASRP